MAEITGVIEKIFFSNNGWMAGLVKTEKGCTKFSGNIVVEMGDDVTLTGEWDNNKRYGKSLKVKKMTYSQDLDETGLANYLAKNKAFKGIGPEKARLIAEKFYANFFDAIVSDPEGIKKAGKLSDKTLETLQDEWHKRSIYNKISVWLSSFELTAHQIKVLIEKYGDNLQDKITENPYIICKEIKGIGFLVNDKIALNMGIKRNSPMRIQAAILYVLWDHIRSGHCWVDDETLVGITHDLLGLGGEDENVIAQTKALMRQEEIVGIEHENKIILAVKLMYDHEVDVFNAIAYNALDKSRGIDHFELEAFVKKSDLNFSQRTAMFKSLIHKISLISGAAGSGKSYTIGKIVEFCLDKGLTVELAAPTGKAARRMEELSGIKAKTIHRMMGFDGNRWSVNRDNQLDCDIVILDEVSMMDVNLAWRFFEGINLLRTQIIFVGDHNQLPPVGPGNILRDMINRELVPTTILDQVVRQAGQLKENCTAILEGEIASDSKEENGIYPWELIREDGDHEDLRSRLLILMQGLLYDNPDGIKNIQVLTPTKMGDLGTHALNKMLQEVIHRVYYKNEFIDEKCRLKTHDKVMQMRNNYDMDVMNGEVGYVVYSEEGERGTRDLTIDFDGIHHVINSSDPEMGDLQLSYACTIHKYQGSEVGTCIALIHSSHMFMLHRNLLYTAVTRAKNVCILICNNRGIYGTVNKIVVDKRRTFMELLEKKNDRSR